MPGPQEGRAQGGDAHRDPVEACALLQGLAMAQAVLQGDDRPAGLERPPSRERNLGVGRAGGFHQDEHDVGGRRLGEGNDPRGAAPDLACILDGDAALPDRLERPGPGAGQRDPRLAGPRQTGADQGSHRSRAEDQDGRSGLEGHRATGTARRWEPAAARNARHSSSGIP